MYHDYTKNMYVQEVQNKPLQRPPPPYWNVGIDNSSNRTNLNMLQYEINVNESKPGGRGGGGWRSEYKTINNNSEWKSSSLKVIGQVLTDKKQLSVLRIWSPRDLHHHHLSLNYEGRWGATDDFATSFLHFPVLYCPLGLGELQACPFPDVIFPPLPLSALSSSPFHCALQDGSTTIQMVTKRFFFLFLLLLWYCL